MHPDLESCKAILENENLTCIVKQGNKAIDRVEKKIQILMGEGGGNDEG